jgi:hypothetical protein
MIVLISGCAMEHNQAYYLSIWRSQTSSIEQRRDAVDHLIPAGTKQKKVEELLGTNYIGFTISTSIDKFGNIPFGFDYQFGNDHVGIYFEKPPGQLTNRDFHDFDDMRVVR